MVLRSYKDCDCTNDTTSNIPCPGRLCYRAFFYKQFVFDMPLHVLFPTHATQFCKYMQNTFYNVLKQVI